MEQTRNRQGTDKERIRNGHGTDKERTWNRQGTDIYVDKENFSVYKYNIGGGTSLTMCVVLGRSTGTTATQ